MWNYARRAISLSLIQNYLEIKSKQIGCIKQREDRLDRGKGKRVWSVEAGQLLQLWKKGCWQTQSSVVWLHNLECLNSADLCKAQDDGWIKRLSITFRAQFRTSSLTLRSTCWIVQSISAVKFQKYYTQHTWTQKYIRLHTFMLVHVIL